MIVHIITGAVIGTALFVGIYFMGYRTGYKAGREAQTIATIIERYKLLKNNLAEIESVTKPEPTTKSTNETKTKTGREEL